MTGEPSGYDSIEHFVSFAMAGHWIEYAAKKLKLNVFDANDIRQCRYDIVLGCKRNGDSDDVIRENLVAFFRDIKEVRKEIYAGTRSITYAKNKIWEQMQ
ncbi:MAG: hypothetical protein H7842_02490 [Gammaproteobacteria bacterium SHHR-1]